MVRLILKWAYVIPFLTPVICCFYRELQYRSDARKSPDTPTGCIGLVIVCFNVVFLLIGDQKITETPLLERDKTVFLAIKTVHTIQIL